MALLIAAVRQGAAIPRALDAVGGSVGGVTGHGMRKAASSLTRGIAWGDAWLGAGSENDDDRCRPAGSVSGTVPPEGATADMLAVLEDSLEPSWNDGVSPVSRLESALDQLDADERTRIEELAGRMTVRLLIPTGLCFLPAFIFIGVIPSIMSFIV
ncbi:hypothetical protein KIH76_07670 [Bifidobacterium sp. 81T8]|nr:hypothetical protein [Bifidobacterium simiiventris]